MINFSARLQAACLVALVAALVAGCGTKEQRSGPQTAADSTGVSFDSTSVPKVVNDSTPVSLRYRLRRGESFHYSVSLRSFTEGTFNGQPTSAKEDSKYYFTLTGDGIRPDSTIHVVVVFDSIQVAVSGGNQGDRSFSSTDTTQMHDPQYALYSSLIRTPIPIGVKWSGEIKEVDSVESIVDRILEMHPDRKGMPPNVKEILKDQVTEAGVKTVVQHVFIHLPRETVKKNGTWDMRFNSAADAFPTENTITYTLTGLSTGGAERTGTVSSKLSVKVLQKKLADSTATLALRSSNFSAEAVTDIDLDRGIARHKEARMQVAMEVLARGLGEYATRVGGEVKKTMLYETTVDRR